MYLPNLRFHDLRWPQTKQSSVKMGRSRIFKISIYWQWLVILPHYNGRYGALPWCSLKHGTIVTSATGSVGNNAGSYFLLQELLLTKGGSSTQVYASFLREPHPIARQGPTPFVSLWDDSGRLFCFCRVPCAVSWGLLCITVQHLPLLDSVFPTSWQAKQTAPLFKYIGNNPVESILRWEFLCSFQWKCLTLVLDKPQLSLYKFTNQEITFMYHRAFGHSLFILLLSIKSQLKEPSQIFL